MKEKKPRGRPRTGRTSHTFTIDEKVYTRVLSLEEETDVHRNKIVEDALKMYFEYLDIASGGENGLSVGTHEMQQMPE